MSRLPVIRRRGSRLLVFCAVCGFAGAGAGPAAAAVDPSSVSVACTPASVAAGSPVSCTATVTDTAVSGASAPTGAVSFGSAAGAGSFSAGGSCALAATTGAAAACTVSFTPAEGGDDTVTASYAGVPGHSAAAGTATVTGVDATTTSLACDASTVVVNTEMTCTATISDQGSPISPSGEVSFTTGSASASFSSPGVCPFTPTAAENGGTAVCQVTFSASAGGTYGLTASYQGDRTHAASSGTTTVTVTTTPANGGPDSGGPGVTLPTGPLTPTPTIPNPGTISIAARKVPVSVRHIAAVRLSCAGAAGATCQGTLALTTRVAVKKKVTVPVKPHHGKKPSSKKPNPKTRTKTKTVHEAVQIGTASYTVNAGTSVRVSVRLSTRGFGLLRASKHHRLKASALTAGIARGLVLVPAKGHKHKPGKRHKHHHKPAPGSGPGPGHKHKPGPKYHHKPARKHHH